MNAHRQIDTEHPHFVAIPNPGSEGIRSYREPEVPHPLQIAFLEEAGERAWVEQIRDLLAAGRAKEADARLAADLAKFEGPIARLCRETSLSGLSLEGWEDLLPILQEWEGPPITAITVGLTNPADLAFEPGKTHEPELLIGVYSDESYPFSSSKKVQLLAECRKDLPAWVGKEEDVEFYCQFAGLAELNTALVNCKHRYFLRDGRDGVEGRAPGGYVEFVLASWFLATRFMQVIQSTVAEHGLPDGCRLIIGTVDMAADFLSISGPDKGIEPAPEPIEEPVVPSLANLTIKPSAHREDPVADAPLNVRTARERLRIAEAVQSERPQRPGFLSRILGRFGRRQA